jgi:hypothetical protein
MSLVVSAFWTDPTSGQYCQFTDWDDGHYMAGVEASRRDVWGSKAVRMRGATFLPQLGESDLWVGHEDLPAFVAEVQSLLSDLDALRIELGRGADCGLHHHFRNFLRAAEYAFARGGGICVT